MIENIQKLLLALDEQLKFIDLEQDDPIKRAELSIDICLKATNKLKTIILKHKFKNQT